MHAASTASEAGNSAASAGQDSAIDISSRVVAEQGPTVGGQPNDVDEAVVNEKAEAIFGLDGTAESDPPVGLAPVASMTFCLKVQEVRVASDASVASNSEEAAHRPTDESADAPFHVGIKQRGPVELARECRVEADSEPLALLEQRLPSAGLVADRYGLNITLEKLRCLKEPAWLNREVITFWLEWWCERIGAGTEHRAPQSTSGPKCWMANTFLQQAD